MATGKRRRADDVAGKMQELGFELRPPVDEYSYQPDSGSHIGGIRGKQEYGIAGGIADESDPLDRRNVRSESDIDGAIVGVSEFTEQVSHAPDEVEDAKRPSAAFDRSPDQLEEVITDRLDSHDTIDSSLILVTVEDEGRVLLEGEARSAAEKLRVEEVVSAIPGVKSIVNRLEIAGGQPH